MPETLYKRMLLKAHQTYRASSMPFKPVVLKRYVSRRGLVAPFSEQLMHDVINGLEPNGS